MDFPRKNLNNFWQLSQFYEKFDNFWKLWQYLTNLTISDNFNNFRQLSSFLTILTQDLWLLKHWSQFWRLRNWIYDNLCYLTIKSDTGQHSQFLQCFKHRSPRSSERSCCPFDQIDAQGLNDEYNKIGMEVFHAFSGLKTLSCSDL